MDKDYISGITFSGGDPLHPQHRDEVFELAKEIKSKFPAKNSLALYWVLWEDFEGNPNLQYIDVFVDGEFMEDLKDVNLPWVGSSNQRIIDVQRTLKEKVLCIVLNCKKIPNICSVFFHQMYIYKSISAKILYIDRLYLL